MTETQEHPAAVETAAEPEVAEAALPDQEPIVAELAAIDQDQRRDWARRIREEQRLPAALRERLAAVVEEAARINGSAEPSLTVTQVASVLAEAVPSLLALEGPPTVAPHPAGEGFFRAGELSDRDASRLAAEQLARTGFGR